MLLLGLLKPWLALVMKWNCGETRSTVSFWEMWYWMRVHILNPLLKMISSHRISVKFCPQKLVYSLDHRIFHRTINFHGSFLELIMEMSSLLLRFFGRNMFCYSPNFKDWEMSFSHVLLNSNFDYYIVP